MTPLQAGEINFDVALVSSVLLGNLWTAEQVRHAQTFLRPVFWTILPPSPCKVPAAG
ncbi:MAG: hypothetical protein U0401_29165 [Anaerolineae bacterium]